MKPINLIYNPLHPDPNRLKTVVSHLFDRSGLTAFEWSETFDVYPCIQKADVVESINQSHKMLVRLAKEANRLWVCILEDDVYFPAPDGWHYWLKNRPAEFKIYLAGTYGQPPGDKVAYPAGIHAYFIHHSFYDEFLSLPSFQHIDTALEGKGPFDICYPYAAIQRSGWSANLRKEVNYNRGLRPEDVYAGPDPDFYTTLD